MSDAPSSSGVVHTELPRPKALPANVTFDYLIRRNKRRSVLLIICMMLIAVVLGATIGALLGAFAMPDYDGRHDVGRENIWAGLGVSALLGAGVALLIGGFGSLWSYFGGSNAILRMSGARPIEKKDDPQLFNVVEELSIAAGTPMPKVYMIDDDSLNAFATGRDPDHAAVAITRGLRKQLTRDELAGVMAHEIAHIRNYDVRLMMLMATMVGLIVLAADGFRRMMFYGAMTGGGRRGGGRGGGGGGGAIVIVLLVITIILSIIAPILAMMIKFAVSRQREYLADASAVELTRYPQGLIGALEKLGGCRQTLTGANRATAHMYIVNPLKEAMKGQGHNLSSTFRTHPPLKDRIARLQALLH